MNQEAILSHTKDYSLEEGMLFVRTTGILTSMVQAPLLVVGLFVVAISIPAQNSFASIRTLDLNIYPDGTTHVFSEFSVNPLEPDYTVELFGTEIDNFVAEDEDGILLLSTIEGATAIVETLGSSKIIVDYDTHDLVSKQGRIWSFNIDSPTEYTLFMPKNTVIVGMSTYPINMQIIEEKSQLHLPNGPAEINYFFGIANPIQTPPQLEENNDNSLLLIGGALVAAGIIGAFTLMKKKQKTPSLKLKTTQQKQVQETGRPLDIETIFKLRPDIREDDKEIVTFIFENGGQAYESELRKKFLQPRTTMWRAVKRLERHGIVTIEKKELQNLVKLATKLEEEN